MWVYLCFSNITKKLDALVAGTHRGHNNNKVDTLLSTARKCDRVTTDGVLNGESSIDRQREREIDARNFAVKRFYTARLYRLNLHTHIHTHSHDGRNVYGTVKIDNPINRTRACALGVSKYPRSAQLNRYQPSLSHVGKVSRSYSRRLAPLSYPVRLFCRFLLVLLALVLFTQL